MYTITISANRSFMSDNPYHISYQQEKLDGISRMKNCGSQIGFRGNSVYCANFTFHPSGLTITPFIDMNDYETADNLISEINEFISDTSVDVFEKVIKLDKIDGIQVIKIKREDDK